MASMKPGAGMGPRPGLAACSFGQGIVEMVLRLSAAIFGLFLIITGALILGFNNSYNRALNEDISSVDTIQTKTKSAGALCIVGGILVLIWAVVMIGLRVLNIGLLNLASKYFILVDVVINFILSGFMLPVGIITAVFTPDWGDLNGDDADAVFASMIATIIVCFSTSFLLLFLAIYMIIYRAKEWNDKIMEYTLKEVVTG